MFDLTVFKYNRLQGKEESELPGLFTSLPPKRPARGREKDRLVIFLQLAERNTPLQGAPQDLLEKMSRVYYATRGPVTSAMKAVADQVNERLLARNLRQAKEANPLLGLLSVAVFHEEMLYLAHCGPVHSYVIHAQTVEHYHDPQGAGRGLGISRTTSVRFYRCPFQPGDLALLCVKPPQNWSRQTLLGSAQLSLDNLRRRLLVQPDENFSFVMLRTRKGAGEILVRNLRSGEPEFSSLLRTDELLPAQGEKPETLPAAPPVTQMTAPAEQPQESKRATYLTGEKEQEAAPTGGVVQRLRDRLGTMRVKAARNKTSSDVQSAAEIANPPVGESRQKATGEVSQPAVSPLIKGISPAARKAGGWVSRFLHGWQAFKQRSGAALSRWTARMLPGKAERLPALSNSAMLFIAVVVPLIVVAVAMTAYWQQGRGEQHRLFLSQAEQMVAQADAQTDVLMKRVNYEAALGYLDQAAEFGNSERMRDLRRQILTSLDQLEGIRRLEFSALLPGPFDGKVNITRIVSTPSEDLYLLDQASGRVIRLVYTRPGYEVDSRFFCGPNLVGGLIIGPLVDIAPAPIPNSLDAVVMGIDAFGNLLYCSLDANKTSAIPLRSPDAGWGEIRAMVYSPGLLLLLDPRSNAVWRFDGQGVDFSDPQAGPRLFFSDFIPDLSKAMDIAIYQNDLFIIREDGGMALCTYSSVSSIPTRCNDPYPYRISRAGEPPEEVDNLGVNLTQIQATQPPEPSLYLLNPSSAAVFQFSLGMTFVQEIRPLQDGATPIPSRPATAFRVTMARNLILAFGNQLFIASLSQ
ncbi:MAG: hypothetical protein KatS3mg045_0877 [Bellilinea sp.]|nr:MAG: hypothetical protein KatS3mg045_0877 [Bellilinea sp.]